MNEKTEEIPKMKDFRKVARDNITENILDSYEQARKFLIIHEIRISTITLDCKLGQEIEIENFAKYVKLDENSIASVKYGGRGDLASNRSVIPLKKSSPKCFYNQATILLKPTNNTEHNHINTKVFKNGSIQMTGCKDMNDFCNVIEKLIAILKKGRNGVTPSGKKRKLNFLVENKDGLQIGIYKVNIHMINSNFKVPYKIDRKELVKMLIKNHSAGTEDQSIGYVDFKYEPTTGHSCVNMKHYYTDEPVNKTSIFIFQTGSIIITGAKTLQHIIAAYNYIIKILETYKEEIKIVEVDMDKLYSDMIEYTKKKTNKNAL
jgi:TATA-box binding protein (TBP) (component of TFIID and TFIIIB)